MSLNKDDFLKFVQDVLTQHPEWSGGVTHVMTIALTESVRLSKIRADDMETVAFMSLNKVDKNDSNYMADLLEKHKDAAALAEWGYLIDGLRSRK